MHALEKLAIATPTTSRRLLLNGGLAAGFMLAFRLPLRAADEILHGHGVQSLSVQQWKYLGPA